MSEKPIFNGPVSFSMDVFIANDETGQAGKTSMGLGVFEYPTPKAIKERLDKFVAEEMTGALEGFRIMTKEEAWKAAMFENTGQNFEMMGNKEWDEIEA